MKYNFLGDGLFTIPRVDLITAKDDGGWRNSLNQPACCFVGEPTLPGAGPSRHKLSGFCCGLALHTHLPASAPGWWGHALPSHLNKRTQHENKPRYYSVWVSTCCLTKDPWSGLRSSERSHQGIILLPFNPFTPERDQCQISPAASPEILQHTVRRTWLFIAYSDERWLKYKFSLHHLCILSLKG